MSFFRRTVGSREFKAQNMRNLLESLSDKPDRPPRSQDQKFLEPFLLSH
jgi:hypothetical protein